MHEWKTNRMQINGRQYRPLFNELNCENSTVGPESYVAMLPQYLQANK